MQIPAASRERLQRLPLIAILVFFVTLIAVGFMRIPALLLIWLAVWSVYGFIRFAFALSKKLSRSRR